MTYLKLKNNRLRISLTKNETEQIFGSSEKLDKDDPKTSLALKALFRRAMSDNNFEVDASSIFIEVAKNLSGGYDIYFSKSKYVSLQVKTSLLVLEFSSCEKAICASKAILSSKHDIADSRFYKYFDKYRMIILTKSSDYDLSLALEYADNIFTTRTDTAKTIEHGSLIIKENAAEVLANL